MLSGARGGHDASVASSHGCHAPATEVIKSAHDVVDDTDPTQSALRQRLDQVHLAHTFSFMTDPQLVHIADSLCVLGLGYGRFILCKLKSVVTGD